MAKNEGQTSTPRGLTETASIGDVKRYLVQLISRVDRGRVSVKKGNCLAQICNVLISCIVDHEIEQRIEALERQRTGQVPRPGLAPMRQEGSA